MNFVSSSFFLFFLPLCPPLILLHLHLNTTSKHHKNAVSVSFYLPATLNTRSSSNLHDGHGNNWTSGTLEIPYGLPCSPPSLPPPPPPPPRAPCSSVKVPCPYIPGNAHSVRGAMSGSSFFSYFVLLYYQSV